MGLAVVDVAVAVEVESSELLTQVEQGCHPLLSVGGLLVTRFLIHLVRLRVGGRGRGH